MPNKGALLTQLSAHWFALISKHFPELKTHLKSTSLPASVPSNLAPQLEKRSMQVKRVPVIPLESIVRGYITGSAWSEYKKSGTVHGMPAPAGLQESQKLEKPLWTPSTKAEQGEHDENISKQKAIEIVGEEVAKKVEEASLKIYEMVSVSSSTLIHLWHFADLRFCRLATMPKSVALSLPIPSSSSALTRRPRRSSSSTRC